MCIVVREARWVNDFGSFSVTEKDHPLHRVLVPSPGVDNTLSVPLYLNEGFHSRAISRNVDDSWFDCESFG